MASPSPYSYDLVPYTSHAFPQSHPDRLAVIATLLGLNPPRPERSRILELGAASGGNLIPLAIAMPGATFVGIELSERQVAAGRDIIQALDLKNIELRHASILDVFPKDGLFDYIICHGVFSWVPTQVQDKIFQVCKGNLAPEGVAYVSYNTYPGWHMRGMIREMMCYYTRRFAEPATVVGQARALLDFLARAAPQDNNPYSSMLKTEVDMLRGQADSYLYHDHLEEHNQPLYFHQFVERAKSAGLRYQGEADFAVMVPGNFTPEVQEVLQKLSTNDVDIEQFMDFIRNRTFRQTLLCHDNLAPNFKIDPAVVAKLHVSSPAKPMSPNPNIRSSGVEQFQGPDGTTLSSGQPLVKAAMLHLSEHWPRAIPFEELRAGAHAKVTSVPVYYSTSVRQESQELAQRLLHFHARASTRVVEFHVCQPCFASKPSPRPRASPLVRLQAKSGMVVTSLRHEAIVLEEFDRQLVQLLDGENDREAILSKLGEKVASEELRIEKDGRQVKEPALVRNVLGQTFEQRLPILARQAMFVE